MTDEIRISTTMSLPVEAVTETFGILAMRGAGKSNAVVVMAEEMYRLGLPWVAIDPKGDWWGLRSNLKGTGPGLSIPIFGGLHGDLPLEPEAGAFIADLIVNENLTCILDVSEFASKAKQARFLADFADRLYRNHGKMPQPRHIFAEEADEFIPQMVRADMARCVGAWERLVKRGRQRGLGVSLVSQRSASINKDVLTQILTLIVLRTTSPQDRKAIMGWVDYHEAARQIVDEIPTLKSGDAWVFSPQWLGRTERVTFRQRSTFDSGGTPVMGTKRAVATLADIDLGKLSGELASMKEREVANDPAVLKRRIAELEGQLKNVKPEQVTVTVEVATPFIPASIIDVAGDFVELANKLSEMVNESLPVLSAPTRVVPVAPVARTETPREKVHVVGPRPIGPTNFKKVEKAILTVLAQFPEGRSRRQLAMLAGYAMAGGFNNGMSSLRMLGFINRGGEPVMITPEGLAAIDGHYEPLPTGKALIDHWLAKLNKAEKSILTVLLEAWPNPMSKSDLAAAAGYEVAGGFNNAMSRLRTLELVTRGTEIRVDETLAKESRS
jgi:hypothetical protein